MSKKSWWVVVAALSLMPLAACEAPGERGEEPLPTETDPATGTDVEETETDPATESYEM